MTPDPSPHQIEVEQKIRAHEAAMADDVAAVSRVDEHWDEYRQLIRQNALVFEGAGVALGVDLPDVQKRLAAHRELDRYVGQLAQEQSEFVEEAARVIRSAAEAESERLRREKAGAPWA